ncbi:SRPBCC domain-containing protein [Streptomyces europaeiscabiei]|uniref:SRPBCC domain-containing protein n=1 Tax=Streptomyces europaeiscabiei TaxID=146819 RepID=A0AAJ2PR21_9ACTN|nr:SRPBCC domain-containing protein [Streptomyces europaeiscabiei]MDX3131657.1 SRPBCC domain-containing protein [Streptomyces europaeiscabiei]
MTMRSTGLTKDAGWEVGVSRTLPQSPAAVWEFISGPRGLELWLGAGARLTPERGTAYETDAGAVGEVRGYRPGDRIRVTYGETTVQVAVSAAGGGRTVLVFHQERMASTEERERQRAHWRRVMDQVAEALDELA